MLSYCPNRDCPDRTWRYNATFCDRCGTELTPCIDCLCGKSCYNPTDQRYMPRFCMDCGREWTEAYLAECMRAQLKGLVAQVAEKWSALPA